MPSLKDVKLQIAGVKKTKQITRAMGMVASAGLRGAQQRIERFRPYADKFNTMLSDLAARTEGASHALLENHDSKKNVLILLITSDRGLCGAFNVNLINTALKLAKAKQEEGKEVSFICVGRKGRDAIKKTEYRIFEAMTDVMGNLNFQVATKLGNIVSHSYTEYNADEVYLVYSEFVSMSRQVPASMPLLPVVPSESGEQNADVDQAGVMPISFALLRAGEMRFVLLHPQPDGKDAAEAMYQGQLLRITEKNNFTAL